MAPQEKIELKVICISIGDIRILGSGLELACNGGSCEGITLDSPLFSREIVDVDR